MMRRQRLVERAPAPALAPAPAKRATRKGAGKAMPKYRGLFVDCWCKRCFLGRAPVIDEAAQDRITELQCPVLPEVIEAAKEAAGCCRFPLGHPEWCWASNYGRSRTCPPTAMRSSVPGASRPRRNPWWAPGCCKMIGRIQGLHLRTVGPKNTRGYLDIHGTVAGVCVEGRGKAFWNGREYVEHVGRVKPRRC
jgi:hypothetical protein